MSKKNVQVSTMLKTFLESVEDDKFGKNKSKKCSIEEMDTGGSLLANKMGSATEEKNSDEDEDEDAEDYTKENLKRDKESDIEEGLGDVARSAGEGLKKIGQGVKDWLNTTPGQRKREEEKKRIAALMAAKKNKGTGASPVSGTTSRGQFKSFKRDQAEKDKGDIQWVGEDENLNEAAFSRQHYQAIANILRKSAKGRSGETEIIQEIGEKLADLFVKDNPRFDAPKFYAAAGLEDSSAETHYKDRG